MALLNVCPNDLDICVSRGDTQPWTFTIKDDQVPPVVVNITGFSYRLTVDPSDEPVDSANNLFTLTGTITDGPNGVVQFAMTSIQSDQTPDVYFYDLEQTDGATDIRTISKGEFEFKQDISK